MSSKARSSEALSGGFADLAQGLSQRLSGRGMAERSFVLLDGIPSTHLLGRRIAQEYSQEHTQPPKSELVAWRQSAGQGREGRTWSSPPGGAYVTLIRSLASGEESSNQLQVLPLLVATALCEELNVDLENRCRLKWPNDLLVDGRKLGGILIDAASRSDEGSLVVISFGVNHQPLDQEGTASLEQEAPGRTELADLTFRLITAIDRALDRGQPADEIVRRYRRLSLHQPGDTLRCHWRGKAIEGEFQGFDEHGFLRLEVGGQERLLTAGEIIQHE